jgi:hypothetical protein
MHHTTDDRAPYHTRPTDADAYTPVPVTLCPPPALTERAVELRLLIMYESGEAVHTVTWRRKEGQWTSLVKGVQP